MAAQFVREFAKLGLTRSVGGVLGLALSRELTPVVTSIILAGMFCIPQRRLVSTTKFLSIAMLLVMTQDVASSTWCVCPWPAALMM